MTSSQHQCRPAACSHQNRNAALMICVLVCLLVASSVAISSVRSALATRRQVRLQHQMRQTELLLQAGILRAVDRLAQSDDFESESWQPRGAIDQFDHPFVEIRVSKQNDARLVEVVASLGAGQDEDPIAASRRTRRSYSFRLPDPKIQTAE